MWILPMRAQFLADGDHRQRQTLLREDKESFIFERKDNYSIEEDIKKNHLQAYMKWAVSGAVDYYKTGITDSVPPTIARDTDNEARPLIPIVKELVEKYLMPAEGHFVSIEEMKQVMLVKYNFSLHIDDTKKDEIFKALNLYLVGERDRNGNFIRPLIPGVKHDRLAYPGYDGKTKKTGFLNVQWKPGKIGAVVNKTRLRYRDGAGLGLIPEATANGAEESDSDDTMDA